MPGRRNRENYLAAYTPYICMSLETGSQLMTQVHRPSVACACCGESMCLNCGARLEKPTLTGYYPSLRPVRRDLFGYHFVGDTEFGRVHGFMWATAFALLDMFPRTKKTLNQVFEYEYGEKAG